MSKRLTRRKFVSGAIGTSGLLLSGCNASGILDQSFYEPGTQRMSGLGRNTTNPAIDPTTTASIGGSSVRPSIGVDANLTSAAQMYKPISDGGYQLDAVPFREIDQAFRRQRVPNIVRVNPGDIFIDTRNYFAYLGLSADEAVRYGVGVGKAGFEWQGTAKIGRKSEWPVWTPPQEMIARSPELAKYANGMPPGPQNPLGARSMYLFSGGRDTLYRLHGSPEWDSIGKSMSSGCIRFLNHDIIDLYQRTPVGTRVTVV